MLNLKDHSPEAGYVAADSHPGSSCRCEEYRAALERISVFYRGGERANDSMLEMRAIAKHALGYDSVKQ